MTAFQRKFTDDQRTAIVQHALNGSTAAKAYRAAIAGHIQGVPKGLDISYQTVAEWVREEKSRLHAGSQLDTTSKPLDEAIGSMALRLAKLEERELIRLERQSRNGKPHDPNRAQTVARNLKAIAAILPTQPAANGKQAARDEDTTQATLIERLAKQAATKPAASNGTMQPEAPAATTHNEQPQDHDTTTPSGNQNDQANEQDEAQAEAQNAVAVATLESSGSGLAGTGV